MTIIADRLREAMRLRGVDQPALARGIGVTQGTISLILLGKTRRSKHLPEIAAFLDVRLAWLMGQDEQMLASTGTSFAVPLAIQHVTMPVALPSEAALAAAYSGLLQASRGMEEAELARELAKRLPTILRAAAGEVAEPSTAEGAAPGEAQAAQGDARPEARRAARS